MASVFVQVLTRFERFHQIEIQGDATLEQLAQLALEMEANNLTVSFRASC